MAQFLIRVEMHERGFDYRLLHDEMERLGCSRQIIADDGSRYNLPEAEYIFADSRIYDTVKLRNTLDVHLSGRGWNFWLLVVRWDAAAWRLAPPSPATALQRLISGM